MATWTVDDTAIGTLSGATFTANTVKGGTTYVHATWMGLTGYATVHVKLHASVGQLNVKFATGGWFGAVTFTVFDVGALAAPWLSVTVSVTV